MDLILNLFTEKELMIIGVVIGSLILIVLILTFIDILTKKKDEDLEFDNMFNELDKVPVEPIKIEEKSEKPVNNNLEEISNIVKKNDVETKIETLEELKPIKNVIENKVEEINEVKEVNEYVEPLIIDVDEDNIKYVEENREELAKIELLKVEEELKNPKSLEDTLYNLEIMEEENAIISYQELLENTSELNVIENDSGDEIISLKEILNMQEEKIDVSSEMSKTSINDAYKGDFTSSPYLSPIVGVEYEKPISSSLAEIQLENTANLEKLDKEIRKTNEFLSILNDLKKNLD